MVLIYCFSTLSNKREKLENEQIYIYIIYVCIYIHTLLFTIKAKHNRIKINSIINTSIYGFICTLYLFLFLLFMLFCFAFLLLHVAGFLLLLFCAGLSSDEELKDWLFSAFCLQIFFKLLEMSFEVIFV